MNILKKIRHWAAYFYRIARAQLFGDTFYAEVNRWIDDQGDSLLRLEYPNLDENSVVFDVGGYLGDFASDMFFKYGSTIFVFEPHPEFFKKCKDRFASNEKVKVFPFGLSDIDGYFNLSDSNDGSSFTNLNQRNVESIRCELKEFFQVLADLQINHIDLMKINIEGGEFQLLQHISDLDKLDLIASYQIQFHNFVEGSIQKRNRIIDDLRKTHECDWCYEFVWESWTKKT